MKYVNQSYRETEEAETMRLCSTTDVSHNEKMSEISRFFDVDKESKTSVLKEVFIDFLKIHEKDAGCVTEEITSKLKHRGLDLNDFRGQKYGNAATMPGKVSRV